VPGAGGRRAARRDLHQFAARVARHSDDTMNAMTLPPPALTEDLLRRLDVPGPRYTSYPTSDRFVDAFTADDYRRALQERSASARARQALSVYVHIPFCESLCYYCACNKVITKHHQRAGQYLDPLERELALQVELLGERRPLSQLHFGGGSPTFLSDAELGRVMQSLHTAFRFAADAEISIEVDPRTVDAARLAQLRQLGFNRLSFGVQDFDPDVQKAVHRVQSYDSVEALMASSRALGFVSINVDLIYGLPHQTRASFARTIGQVATLRPDRIALYAYAHLPQRFKSQRRIHAVDLPPPEDKIGMLAAAIDGFVGVGYVYIGMDHFALPDDSLAAARRQGRLHRNFQGYSTQADRDLVALGVSSIGRIGSTYSQNAKTLPEYYELVNAGRLPVVRGLALSPDDLLRRSVIMSVMCQGRVEFDTVDAGFGIDMREYFGGEFERLTELQCLGLVTLEPRALQVTPLGWYFVRAVAMVFDRALQADRTRERFSRIV
jgi:oxygen-independent coproporphyrinogen-3 oxidase